MESMMNLTIEYVKIVNVMLFYRQISDENMPLWSFLLVPVLFELLFFFFPPLAFFGYFVSFVLYSFYRNREKDGGLKLFYGLYPIVLESLLGRMLAFYVFPFFGISVYNEASIGGYDLLIELLVFPLYLVLIKSLKINFQELKAGFARGFFRRFLLPINLSMMVYTVLITAFLVLRDHFSWADSFRGQLNNLYIIIFFVVLLYINAVSKERLEAEVLEQKDSELKALSEYSHHVEELYGEIRSFRHDYMNILTSLKLGIERKDFDSIQNIYNTVLKDSGKPFYSSKFDLAKLSRIENDAVKSVLSAKLLEAQSKGIETSVEIEEEIYDFQIELLDFIKILSILCDNAIEGCLTAEDPKIAIALIREERTLILVVENSTKAEKLELSPIFEKGYSSKGEGRGLGLYNVRTILEKYPKSLISTRSANHLFSQTIQFCK